MVYVDDLLIIETKQKLRNHFSIKDLGALKYFLGLKFPYDNCNEIFISQRKYALDLLTFLNYLIVNPYQPHQ